MQEHDVIIGVDVGKSFHYLYALAKGNEVLFDGPVVQCEHKLIETFSAMRKHGSVLVVPDLVNNVGSLPLACARKTGCDVAYLPGLAMRRAAGILPGDKKTDGYDSYVICMTAKCMPQSLRAVPSEVKLRGDLLTLASYDDDCRCDLTREINRLRAHLIECNPAFERALKDNITSPFVIKLLMKYGGPHSIRKATRGKVLRWAGTQKHVPKALLARLLGVAFEMSEAPMGALLREEVAIPACAKRIGELIGAREEMVCRMEAMLVGNPLFEALKSMPGMGTRTVVAFIIHVDISAFSSVDKLASYAGVAPRTRQSGTSIKGESASKIGNRTLKNALYLSAFASLRCDVLSREYYDKKRAEGKKHSVALVCLARRRLKIMYALARDLMPYSLAA